MSLVLYDTLRRAEVPFVARDEGKAAMYVCGPTVQSDAHVGHGRLLAVSDLLRRHLRHQGYDVTYVQNVTDIDDKIILRARREKVAPAVIATRYTLAWNRCMDALGVTSPDVQPFATGHLLEMQALITQLIDAGKAYAVDGDVFFRVRSFEAYGALSRRRIDELEQGADVVDADRKEDPLDFALWKSAKPGEPAWPSPWGEGRPGWHIECSVMATKHLGAAFDIHCGGLDLVFPHHENEIAQFEAAHNETFVRHWVHNGMVQMGDEKMSKSIGNVVGLHEAIDTWGRGPMRLWYLSAQHRTPLTFETERLRDASATYDRFVTFVRSARRFAGEVEADAESSADHRQAFVAAMNDDLNAPSAVAALHELASAGNDLMSGKDGDGDRARAAVAGHSSTLVELADEVLGLGVESTLAAAAEIERRVGPLVDQLLTQRQTAREDRDFATADVIRDQIAAAGIIVEDGPDGARWHADIVPIDDPAAATSSTSQ
ncbi:MAG: cysteine--tRNA ligase [Nitriliruptoraceae bacterium]